MNYNEYLYSLGYVPYPVNYINRYGYGNNRSELVYDNTIKSVENLNECRATTNNEVTYKESKVVNNNIQNRDNSSSYNMAIELIKNSINDEAEDEAFYDFIISIAPNEEQQEIIQSIRDDERKHNRLLRNLYTELTGTTLPMNTFTPKKKFDMTYNEALEKAFLGEVAAVSKYQKILKEMKNMEQHNTILEILTDELRHADKYNYLMNKNS